VSLGSGGRGGPDNTADKLEEHVMESKVTHMWRQGKISRKKERPANGDGDRTKPKFASENIHENLLRIQTGRKDLQGPKTRPEVLPQHPNSKRKSPAWIQVTFHNKNTWQRAMMNILFIFSRIKGLTRAKTRQIGVEGDQGHLKNIWGIFWEF
jgi:hypothetical protein